MHRRGRRHGRHYKHSIAPSKRVLDMHGFPDAWKRSLRICKEYCDGNTLGKIAQAEGLTTERIRQIVRSTTKTLIVWAGAYQDGGVT